MQNGVRVVIHAPNEVIATKLNQLLWHYPATAFIPHCQSDSSEVEKVPVVISHCEEKFPHHELLISLHEECVTFFSRFERVMEIVAKDEASALAGRQRFKFYRDRGYELTHHDLSKNNA